MFVVIFRATVRQFDAEYSGVAARLRELALSEFGCTEFHAVTESPSEPATRALFLARLIDAPAESL